MTAAAKVVKEQRELDKCIYADLREGSFKEVFVLANMSSAGHISVIQRTF
jgi:hypothetical protein